MNYRCYPTDVVYLDGRERPAETPGCRATDFRDNMLQFHQQDAVFICDQNWEEAERCFYCIQCSLQLHIQPSAYLASKKLIKCAWRLTIDRCVTFFIIVYPMIISKQNDSHRTLVPIMYPPNTVALGCLYTASLLTTLEPPPSPLVEAQLDSRVATILKEKGDWERTYMAEAEDLEGRELLYLRSLTDCYLPQRLRMYLLTYSYKPRKIR